MNRLVHLYNNIEKVIESGNNSFEVNDAIRELVDMYQVSNPNKYNPLALSYNTISAMSSKNLSVNEAFLMSVKLAIIQYATIQPKTDYDVITLLSSKAIIKLITEPTLVLNNEDMEGIAKELLLSSTHDEYILTDIIWGIMMIGLYEYQRDSGVNFDMVTVNKEYLSGRLKVNQDDEVFGLIEAVLLTNGRGINTGVFTRLNDMLYEQAEDYKIMYG